MNHPRAIGGAIAFLSLLSTVQARAQGSDIYWHIDPSVESCSMVIDPSLTQAEWRTFVRQSSAILSVKSMAPAPSLGRGNFTVGLDYSVTPVDQRDPAWINTFTHPGPECPLGDQIVIPSLRATLGVSERMDVTGYWTTAPGANYGFVGGGVKFGVLKESPRRPAAALTASVATLTGVPDFNFSEYGVGVLTSKRFGDFSPYLGVRENLASAVETTSKVDLARENVWASQGFVGATWSFWRLGATAEYNVAVVNTLTLMVDFRR